MVLLVANKLRDGLYRVLWKTNSNYNHPYNYGQRGRSNYILNETSEVNLSTHGVDERYKMHCSQIAGGNPILTITLEKFDDQNSNFYQREITATFLGYEKKTLFSEKLKSAVTTPSWTAEWTEITNICCQNCNSSLGMAETFEILIDMGPTTTRSLKQGQESVLSHLSHLWESKTLADVTFRFEDKDIKAHTIIVSSGSPVLAAMFQSDFEEKKEKIAVIKETKSDVFEKLLYFIYTGDFDHDFHDIAALMAAADMYNVAHLKEECDLYLSKNVALEEATNYLILAHLHDAKELYKASLNCMRRNSEAIVASQDWVHLLKTHLELGLVAMQFMIKKSEE